ncbi:glycosyltransferase N-terminal domain-containing protein [Mucilaginibacter sp. PAMB04274]|uniref:3-deoxy-D-manno-octulosonic acid transferase n=1 Tax=Mucilaginibacter sp. PAMB04274 TaxID=3138568 RepID=UPI0031F6E312
MLILYNIGIRFYYFFAIIVSLFNTKAKAWVNGRRSQKIIPLKNSIWFHFASLGEFEQGRPVMEAIKTLYPEHPIVVTFFSPSGYEIRKNTPLADAVYYLPLDTASNAQEFVAAIQPVAAIFTKYEYWYHYFNELHSMQVPLYVISAIFRQKQVFFKSYGSLHRQILSKITCLFVQDEASKELLSTIGISNVLVSGDTRFDRVWTNANTPKALPLIQQFKSGHSVFVAGSTWPPDEAIIAPLLNTHPDWKFIFAPHEITSEKIDNLIKLLPKGKTARFSQIAELKNELSTYQALIIDNIGMLSSLYQYGEIAYIGGGFGVGIHNTLEAAAFGLPVIFGPNYTRFKEARDLVKLKAGFSINNQQQLTDIANELIGDNAHWAHASRTAKNYVANGKGATEMIMKNIQIRS